MSNSKTFISLITIDCLVLLILPKKRKHLKPLFYYANSLYSCINLQHLINGSDSCMLIFHLLITESYSQFKFSLSLSIYIYFQFASNCDELVSNYREKTKSMSNDSFEHVLLFVKRLRFKRSGLTKLPL